MTFTYQHSMRAIIFGGDRQQNSQHVFPLQMDRDNDLPIWDYALQNDYVIVTRDSDYNNLSLIRGFPPKVI
jgi:predicted nuclease of predicted toxin-antitoxin system